jgi:hypothetical protein
VRDGVGGYRTATLLFAIIPLAVGLASLTATEPETPVPGDGRHVAD